MRDKIVKNIRKLFKGEKPAFDELAEEVLIVTLAVGASLVAVGVILSAFMPIGLAPIMAMTGALLSFVSLIIMVTLWFRQEGFK